MAACHQATQEESTMESETENTGEFIKRRFSLTHEVNALIDELAGDSHGGNRSACVRAAVYAAHQRRDEDELRHGLKRLQKEIQTLTEQVESLEETHSSEEYLSNQGQSETVTGTSPTPMSGNPSTESDSESCVRVARELYSVMRNQKEDVFKLEDLLTEVEFSLSSVAEGIERLVEQNAVEQPDTGGSPRYRLTD